MNKNLLIIVITAVIMGVVGFFAGTKYQRSKNPRFGNFNQNQRGGQLQQGMTNRQGFRPVNGEIISSDEKSVTVKLQDGSSKIVLFTEKTAINRAQEGSREDLKTGEKVAVIGLENSDGSVTAQSIQLNPAIQFQR